MFKRQLLWLVVFGSGCAIEQVDGADVALETSALRHGGRVGQHTSDEARHAGRPRSDGSHELRPSRRLEYTGQVQTLLPSDPEVGAGNSFEVRLTGVGFKQKTEGGGVNLSFDPTIARVEDIAIDHGVWEFYQAVGKVDNAAGRVKDVVFASFAGRSGDFALGTVRFRALVANVSNLSLHLSESRANPFAGAGRRLSIQLE